jgi:hypothetical protein
VQKWTGAYFAPAWLSEVGIKIHLGHPGKTCSSVQNIAKTPHLDDGDDEAHKTVVDAETDPQCSLGDDGNLFGETNQETLMVIVDTSGVHQLMVRWCVCHPEDRQDLQLLDVGLYPATFKQPKTAFTFNVLDDFLADNLECKTACLNFYSKLRRVTSNAFPQTVPVEFIIEHSQHFD